jgi:hypothetical protein
MCRNQAWHENQNHADIEWIVVLHILLATEGMHYRRLQRIREPQQCVMRAVAASTAQQVVRLLALSIRAASSRSRSNGTVAAVDGG